MSAGGERVLMLDHGEAPMFHFSVFGPRREAAPFVVRGRTPPSLVFDLKSFGPIAISRRCLFCVVAEGDAAIRSKAWAT